MSVQNTINRITELFVITPEEARKYAEEFIELVEAHGGIVSQQVIDRQIPKIFGERLTWRAGKKQEEKQKNHRIVGAYNDYINKKHH